MGLAELFGLDIEPRAVTNPDGSVTFQERDNTIVEDVEGYFFVPSEISVNEQGNFDTATAAETDAEAAAEVVKEAAKSVFFDIGKLALYGAGAYILFTMAKEYAGAKARAAA
jgi:hypothetical protein